MGKSAEGHDQLECALNEAARGLRASPSRVAAALIPNIISDFCASLFAGIREAAEKSAPFSASCMPFFATCLQCADRRKMKLYDLSGIGEGCA